MKFELLKTCCLVLPLALLPACAFSEKRHAMEADEHSLIDPSVTQVAVSEAEIDPDLMFHILVGEIASQRGSDELSLDYYMEAARSSQDLKIVERATRLAVTAGDYEKAEEAVRFWVKLSPTDADARLVMASVHVRKGEIESAREQLETLLKLVGDDRKGFDLIVRALGREPDKANLLKTVSLLVEPRQDDPNAVHAYTVLAMHANDMQLATKSVQRLIKLAPERDDVWVIYARIMLVVGRSQQAVEVMRPIVQDGSPGKLLRITYARLLLNARLNREAKAQFDEILKIDPSNPDVLYSVALLAINSHQDEEAKGYLLKLVNLNFHENAASYYLGQIAERSKDYEGALAWYAGVSQGNFAVDAGVRLAILIGKQGNITKARSQLESLREAHPDRVLPIYLAEGALLRNEAFYQEAIALYTLALEKFAGNSDLLYSRSLVAEKLNDLSMAESDLRAIILSEPNNASALNALGYTLADRTDRYEEALDLIRRAFKIKPLDPAIIDSMGWIQYRLGNLEEGLKYLREAFAKFADPEIASHLGEVLWHLGNKDEAQKVWSDSLQKNPEHPVLKKVIEKFKP